MMNLIKFSREKARETRAGKVTVTSSTSTDVESSLKICPEFGAEKAAQLSWQKVVQIYVDTKISSVL